MRRRDPPVLVVSIRDCWTDGDWELHPNGFVKQVAGETGRCLSLGASNPLLARRSGQNCVPSSYRYVPRLNLTSDTYLG